MKINLSTLLLSYSLIAFFFLLASLFSCRPRHMDVASRTSESDSILDSANQYLNAGELSRSLNHLESAYMDMANQGSIDRWKRYSFLQNFYLYHRVDLERAGSYADSMEMVLEGSLDRYPEAYAATLFAKGDVLRVRKRLGDAFEHYYRGRQLAEQRLDTCFWANFTNRLGLMRYGQQQYLQAVSYFKQALVEQATCGNVKDFDISFVLPQSIYNSIALSYEKAGRTDSAIYFYKMGIAYVQNGRKRFPDRSAYMESALGVFCGNLGGQYLKLGNTALAEDYLLRSISLNDRVGYAREDALTAKMKLVRAYLSSGKLTSAGKLLEEMEIGLFQMEARNSWRRKLELDMIRLRSEYEERIGNPTSAFSLLKRYQKGMDSLTVAEHQLHSADMEDAYKSVAKSHALELAKRDGTLKILYLVLASLLLLMAGLVLWIFWRNILLSKAQVAKLEQALGVLEQSRAENMRMVRIAVHDLRNPLGAVQVLLEMMGKAEELSADGRRMVGLMGRSVFQAIALVNTMLSPEGSGENTKSHTDLFGTLKFCVEQLRTKAAKKNQTIKLLGGHLMAMANAEQLWRALGNLLDNAIKFSPQGAEVEVALERAGDMARITVSDRGIGVPAGLREGLFSGSGSTGRPGTEGEASHGIGLSVVRQLVEGHNGRIWFAPRPGGGSVFHIELPL